MPVIESTTMSSDPLVLICFDVESVHPKRLSQMVSLGYYVNHQGDSDVKCLEKGVIYFPFNVQFADHDTWNNFWENREEVSAEIRNQHVRASTEMGFNPFSRDERILEEFRTKSGRVRECIANQIKKFSNLLKRFEESYPGKVVICKETNFDSSSVDYYLEEFLGEPNLSYARLPGGGFSYSMLVIDTDSSFSLLSPENIQSSSWISNDSVLKRLPRSPDPNVDIFREKDINEKLNHDPSDDAKKMFQIYCLVKLTMKAWFSRYDCSLIL